MSGAVKVKNARKGKGHESISRAMLQTRTLTLKARGLLALLESLPDEWDCNGVEGIVKQFCDQDGQHAVNEAIKELEAHGMFARLKRQGARGKWEWLWTYSQDPADVAAEAAEWEVKGYTTGRRGGNQSAKPPVSGKSQHGPTAERQTTAVLGKSVDGPSVDGKPPDKETYSQVPTGLDSESYSESEPPLRSGSRTPRADDPIDAVFGPAPADEGEEVATSAAIVKADRRGRRGARTPAALNATAHTPTARRLVDAYAQTCEIPPAGRVYTQFCVEVSRLLQAGYPEAVISQALVECGEKGYSAPSLGSFAHGVANRKPTPARRSQTAAAMESVDDAFAQYRAELASSEPAASDALLGVSR